MDEGNRKISGVGITTLFFILLGFLSWVFFPMDQVLKDVLQGEIEKPEMSGQDKEREIIKPELSCLSTFYILGCRKGGTTSLYLYLSKHPNFWAVATHVKTRISSKIDKTLQAQTGETFLLEKRVRKYLKSKANTSIDTEAFRVSMNSHFLREFKRLYPKAEKDVASLILGNGPDITGDASVGNGPLCMAPKLLRESCSGNWNTFRFVYLVRNPIDRIISNFKMRIRIGKLKMPKCTSPKLPTGVTSWSEVEPFEKVVLCEFEEVKKKAMLFETPLFENVPLPCLYKFDYKNTIWGGLYIVHLLRWLEYFDESQVLVLKSESFFEDEASSVKRVAQFAGLDYSAMDVESAVSTRYNSGDKTPSQLSNSTRKLLAEFYRPYNQALARKFNIDISDWD